MGRLLGSLKDLSGADLGGIAIKARARAGRRRARPGRLRDHGPGAAGRCRPDPGAAGRVKARHPDDRARADRQQGVPVRPGRDRAGRPADPGRRVRDRRRRRAGVDDPGPAPAAASRARASSTATSTLRRLDGLRRRCTTPSTDIADGRARPRTPTPAPTLTPRGAGRVRGPRRTSAPPRRRRTASSTTRSSRSRSRSARATRSSFKRRRGHPRRHHGRDRWRGCVRRSPRTARSPPASSSQISDGASRSW